LHRSADGARRLREEKKEKKKKKPAKLKSAPQAITSGRTNYHINKHTHSDTQILKKTHRLNTCKQAIKYILYN